MKYVYIEGYYNNEGIGVDEVTTFSSREETVRYSMNRLESVLRDHNISSLISDLTDLVKELNGTVEKYSGYWSIIPDGTIFGIVKELK